MDEKESKELHILLQKDKKKETMTAQEHKRYMELLDKLIKEDFLYMGNDTEDED